MIESPSADNFNTALLQSISHLRDVSVRDGIQSWDANKWPIADILSVVKKQNTLATIVRKQGGVPAPVEVWGGGQVAQPAKFLGEDPLVNLEEIHAVAPELQLQCLYRGRQGFGFIPISTEVQKTAITAAVDRGVKVFRVFDMMNDITNVATGIEVLKTLKAHGKDVLIEGAISYISEPEGGKRAWSLEDYGDYAANLAGQGCDEITIKNYAGVGDAEMLELIKTIRAKLDAAGFTGMKVNLHTHGKKPGLLADAIKAGADKVDVAFGELADGPSHSNAIETLKALMKQQGVDVDGQYKNMFDNHPIIKAMHGVEDAIEKVVNRERQTDAGEKYTFKGRRAEPLTQEEMDKYRMAGGALSDLWNNYIKNDEIFEKNKRMWETKRGGKNPDSLPPLPQTRKDWFKKVLEVGTELWEKAGRFNTVTPGAFILCSQAVAITNRVLGGEPINMTDYTPEYLDVITGRFGENKGIQNGVGDTDFRGAALMYRALKLFNEAVKPSGESKKEPLISKKQAQDFILAAFMGERSANTEAPIFMKANGELILGSNTDEGDRKKAATLADRLSKTKIGQFAWATETSGLPPSLVDAMLRELRTGKSADPTEGLDKGHELLSAMQVGNGNGSGINVENLHAQGKPISSSPDDLALLVMLLRNRGGDDKVSRGLFEKIAASSPAVRNSKHGQNEAQRASGSLPNH